MYLDSNTERLMREAGLRNQKKDAKRIKSLLLKRPDTTLEEAIHMAPLLKGDGAGSG